ncbi:hypothetical protein ANTPLA_LOCUS7772 [Anthophora plagiata]
MDETDILQPSSYSTVRESFLLTSAILPENGPLNRSEEKIRENEKQQGEKESGTKYPAAVARYGKEDHIRELSVTERIWPMLEDMSENVARRPGYPREGDVSFS